MQIIFTDLHKLKIVFFNLLLAVLDLTNSETSLVEKSTHFCDKLYFIEFIFAKFV